METSLDSIITVDQQGQIIEFNPTAAQTFGYRRTDVLGQRFDELLLTPLSRTTFNQRFSDCSTSGQTQADPQRFELQARHKEGTSFPVEVAIKPTLLHDRLLFTVYVHDISERKHQEAEIKSLAAIPSESPSPVLRVNRPGVVIYANGPSEPLLAYWGCRRLQTLPVYWKQQVQAVLDEGRTRELEIQADAGVYSLLLAPISELGYVNIYARDITKMRAAEEEARQRQNELVHVARLSTMGEMATGIAHELNQPLSAIVNFANGSVRRLKFGVGSSEDLLHALEQIAAQARRAGEIIKRLRGMVSRQQPVREVVDLNQLTRETCAMVAHDVRKLGVNMERRLTAEPLMVRVDPVQIEQVILNLVRNALDALADIEPRARRLTLSSGALASGAVYVAVHDNGGGIRPTVRERLFDPFFTTKQSGMGMGLAITQTIVKDHLGKIRADSGPGRGTVFTLELPAAHQTVKSLAS
jgi:PAS domain S-box-containing protein